MAAITLHVLGHIQLLATKCTFTVVEFPCQMVNGIQRVHFFLTRPQFRCKSYDTFYNIHEPSIVIKTIPHEVYRKYECQFYVTFHGRLSTVTPKYFTLNSLRSHLLQ